MHVRSIRRSITFIGQRQIRSSRAVLDQIVYLVLPHQCVESPLVHRNSGTNGTHFIKRNRKHAAQWSQKCRPGQPWTTIRHSRDANMDSAFRGSNQQRMKGQRRVEWEYSRTRGGVCRSGCGCGRGCGCGSTCWFGSYRRCHFSPRHQCVSPIRQKRTIEWSDHDVNQRVWRMCGEPERHVARAVAMSEPSKLV